jgi:hypothetical protein
MKYNTEEERIEARRTRQRLYNEKNKQDPAWIEKQRSTNKKSYEKHKEERLDKCKKFRDSKQDDEEYQLKKLEWRKSGEDKRRDDPKRKEWKAQYNRLETTKIKDKEYNKTLAGKYNSYKKNASTRNIYFGITLEEFSVFWNKQCEYCGNDIETIGIDRIDNGIGYILTNLTSCCKICNFMKCNLTYDQFKKHIYNITTDNIVLKHNIQNPNYKSYKHGAKTRNLVFDLSKEDFKSITSDSCYYCGEFDSRIGIDRSDNTKGYTLENCVPCCATCNHMKKNHTQSYFISHIQKIYRNLYENI